MTSISEINLKVVNASAKKQTSLYDTPLRELFEEARKKAEEQYKVNKSQIQSATKDDKDRPYDDGRSAGFRTENGCRPCADRSRILRN